MTTVRDVRVESVSPLRLRLLLEVQRRGSIAAAADACAVGQPSASMHLRTLEAATGRMLLRRNGRGSGLTDAGSVVAGHAARILAELDEMQNDLETLEAGEHGTVSIAVSETAAVAVLPGALQRFAERHPGIAVSVETAPSGAVLRSVAHGDVDVGIAGETRAALSVERRTILEDEIVGVAAQGRLKLNAGRAEPDAIDSNIVLVGPPDSSTRAVATRYLARAGLRARRIWELDSAAAVIQAVRAGVGIGFLSWLLVDDADERDEIVAFRIAGVEPMVRPLQLIRPIDGGQTPAAVAFVTFVARNAGLEAPGA
jgi:molybdate transport repressor ModE-like protein